MKTFKLYSLHLWQEDDPTIVKVSIPTKDGLIINMENSKKTWLVDAVISKEHLPLFKTVKKEDKDILVEVVITSPNNFPATMVVHVRRLTEFEETASVLFEGSLLLQKDDVVEHMLHELVVEGYSGQELLEEYRSRKDMHQTNSQVLSNGLYRALKESGQYRL